MEGKAGFTFLQTISSADLINWSVRYLLDTKLAYNDKYPIVPIGDFLVKNRTVVDIQDGVEYSRVTVSANNRGVSLRNTEKGENIGTKRQFRVSAGQFIVSKIDARNGAFGIVPENLDGAIVTNDFPVFDVDDERILIEFLVLITATEAFVKFAQSCSSGTTNRQRIDMDMLLQQRIPLPPIPTQQRIVDDYYNKVEKDLVNYITESHGRVSDLMTVTRKIQAAALGVFEQEIFG